LVFTFYSQVILPENVRKVMAAVVVVVAAAVVRKKKNFI
jgi:hypothetical protein